MEDWRDYLKEHVNVYWLRPESALWDAVASYEIGSLKLDHVDLDLGCGNGIFSFITAGGSFSESFDWFIQAEPESDKNVFDHVKSERFKPEYIERTPRIPYAVAFDKKDVLIEQARTLNWYTDYIESDVLNPWSIRDESISTIFSNIIYWVPDPSPIMVEAKRVLALKGAWSCVYRTRALSNIVRRTNVT